MYIPQTELLINADISIVSRKRSRAQLEATVAVPELKKRRVVVTQEQTPKKSVRFAPEQNQVVIVSTASSSETWYSAQDYAGFKFNMKRDVLYLAQLCKTGNCQYMDRSEYSALGLEKYCCSSGDQKKSKMMKMQRIRCVLDQQMLQRLQGRSEPETIQFMAHVLSQEAVIKALQRAGRVAAAFGHN
ncbi:expressed unknown protein [Seminavis robusta]|uniref:Uncharacterized protein n=1 Tax=Seminavis robusta TaxID=568900 RepID=A0A9N8H7A2_9STRA|nr:expressed unknown protein [Seminavis robusta]|eukprot:Sro64_g036110.1 n/a (187) ;mRNA; f:10971-11531